MVDIPNPTQPDASGIDPSRLASALAELQEWAFANRTPRKSAGRSLIEDHLGVDAMGLPTVAEEYAQVERPDLQRAVDAWVGAGVGRSVEVHGVQLASHMPGSQGLAAVVSTSRFTPPSELGPVSYEELPTGVDETSSVFASALLLFTDGPMRLAALLAPTTDYNSEPRQHLDVMAADREVAAALLGELRALSRQWSVYRHQIVSLSRTGDQSGAPFRAKLGVTFHPRPELAAHEVVLPAGMLDRIERHAVAVGENASALRAAGHELKRGLLLYGPPGTGKTHTVRWLLASMATRTAVLIGGADVSLLDAACRLARRTAPSMVVLEDVDLIAEERTMFGRGQNAMLLQLLNEMDGVDPADDVLFVLTTNRPELLEPALANRPGRVDLAINVPLPDAEARSRLLDLYAADIERTNAQSDALVTRLDGVSGAFVKELARRASLAAAIAGVTPGLAHLTAALDELFEDGSELTRMLIGGVARAPQEPAVVMASAAMRFPPGIPAEVRDAIQRRFGGDPA